MRAVLTLAALLIAPVALPTSASAAARHYDCTKPGNANKEACKTVATPPAASAAAPATVAAAAPAKTARTYDCSKAGNKNKAACKTATVSPAAPTQTAVTATPSTPAARVLPTAPAAGAPSGSPRIVAWTEKNGKVVHYDCTKRGNLTKKACKQ